MENKLTISAAQQHFVIPNWQLPEHISAFTTTRLGGVSHAPYDSLNLGFHVNDDIDLVKQNHAIVQQALGQNVKLSWLQQVHGTDVVQAENIVSMQSEADAVYTKQANMACAVMTADCLPVLFSTSNGEEIAAAHAGWRGLVNGVLEQTLQQFEASSDEIKVWLGPAIGSQTFEVGRDVLDEFMHKMPESIPRSMIEACFCSADNEKFMADIYQLARLRLQAAGVISVLGGGWCTVTDPRFYSYRAEAVTGRMATLIVKRS